MRGVGWIIWLCGLPFVALAQGDCDRLNTDQIDRVIFENGAVVPMMGRAGEVMTYGMAIPNSAEPMQITAAANTFTLRTDWSDQERVMHWESELPKLVDMVPGFTFHETAKVTEDGKQIETITVTGAVIAESSAVVGHCTYPVLEMQVTNALTPGPPPVEVRKWLHVPSLVVLRSTVTMNGKTTENRVKEIIYHTE